MKGVNIMKKNNYIIFLLMISIVLAVNAVSLRAQFTFKFPSKIKYKMYKNNQSIGSAALFYTGETGIERFNRELSALRLTYFQESEDNFQYMFESYIFKDNQSLCLDSFIKSDNTVASQLDLKERIDINGNKEQYFIHKKEKLRSEIQYKPIDQYRTIGNISAVLVACRKVATGRYGNNESFNYFSPPTTGEVQMMYKGRELTSIDKNIVTLHTMALLHNQQEIHRFKIYQDPQGYCYPVSLLFNIDDKQRSIEIRMEKLPVFLPTEKKEDWGIVYLDFMDANSRTIALQDNVEKFVYDAILEEITKKLNTAAARQNKNLAADNNTRRHLNKSDNVSKLMDITFAPDIPIDERIKQITRELNIPAHIDVIVTGQYINSPQNPWLMVRPIIFFKSEQKILTQNLLFKKDDIICREPGTNREILCQDANDYIAYKIKRYFSLYTGTGSEEQGVTIEQVYRMIIKNGFFCHSVDYGFHSEVLERLREEEQINELDSVYTAGAAIGDKQGKYTYVFKPGRENETKVVPGKDFVIETVSTNQNNFSDYIQLYWAPTEGGIKTYPEALEMIRHLNSIRYQGYSDWRLPTLIELFSIAGHYQDQRFFPFLFPGKNIKLWTSTPLDERERDRLTPCDSDVYLVINCLQENHQPKLHFDMICKNHRAYLVPVRSPLSPDGNRPLPPQGPIRLYIGNLAFMKSSDHTPMASGELGQLINREVIKGIKMATRINNILTVNEQSRRMFYTDDNANDLTNIFFDPYLTREEKINRIIQDMMLPNHMDLMVTGLFIEDGRKGMVTIRPVVIYKDDQKLHTKNLQFSKNDLVCWDSTFGENRLCQSAAEKIANAVKELLGRS
jgi:hypothetical protein